MAKNAVLRTRQGEWTGNVVALPTQATGLTAAGSNQATSLQLADGGEFYQVSTAAASTGVKLPAGATGGDELFFTNNGANACAVYPQTGGVLNGTSANTAVSVPAGKSAHCYALTALNWVIVVSA